MNIEEIEANLHQFPAEQGKVIAQLLRLTVKNTAMLEAILTMVAINLHPTASGEELKKIVTDELKDVNARYAEIFAEIFPLLST